MSKKEKQTKPESKSVIKGRDVLYTFHINEGGSLSVTITKGGEKIRTVSKPSAKHTAMWFGDLMNYTLERMADEGRPVLHVTCSVP